MRKNTDYSTSPQDTLLAVMSAFGDAAAEFMELADRESWAEHLAPAAIWDIHAELETGHTLVITIGDTAAIAARNTGDVDARADEPRHDADPTPIALAWIAELEGTVDDLCDDLDTASSVVSDATKRIAELLEENLERGTLIADITNVLEEALDPPDDELGTFDMIRLVIAQRDVEREDNAERGYSPGYVAELTAERDGYAAVNAQLVKELNEARARIAGRHAVGPLAMKSNIIGFDDDGQLYLDVTNEDGSGYRWLQWSNSWSELYPTKTVPTARPASGGVLWFGDDEPSNIDRAAGDRFQTDTVNLLADAWLALHDPDCPKGLNPDLYDTEIGYLADFDWCKDARRTIREWAAQNPRPETYPWTRDEFDEFWTDAAGAEPSRSSFNIWDQVSGTWIGTTCPQCVAAENGGSI